MIISILHKIIELFFMSFVSNIIDLSSFLAAIGSLLAAYMAYRAVNEMKKQRQTTVKPDLSIRGLKHYVYWHPTSLGIPVDWSREKLSSKPSFKGLLNLCRFAYAEMECVNIGYGVAKNIKINWEFDIDTFINLLTKNDRYNLIDSLKNYEDGMVTINSEKLSGDFPFTYSLINEEENIEFILPTSQEENQVTFSLSRPYMMLISLSIFLKAYNLENDKKDFNGFFHEDVPHLKVLLQYEDINKEIFTNKFKVKINFHDLSYHIEGVKKWRLAANQIQFDIKKIEED